MIMRHIGIRPENPIHLVDFRKKIYYEDLPNGKEKRWTLRQLNSGCGKDVKGEMWLREDRGCYYCPWCDEWFSKNQWEMV